MKRFNCLLIWLAAMACQLVSPPTVRAQRKAPAQVVAGVQAFMQTCQTAGYRPHDSMAADSVCTDDSLRTVWIYANEPFTSQPLSADKVSAFYTTLQRCLPAPWNAYRLLILDKKGRSLEELVPNMLRNAGQDTLRVWGKTEYRGLPWVTCTSRAWQASKGLTNRHLFIWPSHGRYYRPEEWRWQRPYLYCTTEDLFTQSIVYPYLYPMLESAGAIVCSPRERDVQTHEALVDNDAPQRQGTYAERDADDAQWQTVASCTGFGMTASLLTDSILPFAGGTCRMVAATTRTSRHATATWTPHIPRTGRYAVYVSYASLPNSVPDATYTVWHKGGKTQFRVNQQMGGGTWVYLGTFLFDEGTATTGRVTLSNHSNYRGVVTADAVRFGGGTGQTERGMAGTSALPRFLEAARYHARWCGVPDTLVNTTGGEDDYKDDLRVRSHMLNYLSGGSVYNPLTAGQRVPFEMSLALHTDAGVRSDDSVYGSLGIYTSWGGDGELYYPSGMSRLASNDLISALLQQLSDDLTATFGKTWTRRELWDRNYAETRMPSVPSAILEMLSHQHFTDMKFGHDPNFKFALARAIYKGVLRFVNYEHGLRNVVTQPLPVHRFAVTLHKEHRTAMLSWLPTTDSLDATAQPTGYVLYTKTGNDDFDNGRHIGSGTQCEVPIVPGIIYSFRITAVNDGGESFPSETLSACLQPDSRHTVLVVNNFTRLSGPARIETADSLGFDLAHDMGMPYLYTTAFAGRQLNFNRSALGVEGRNGLGFCGNELMGQRFAGNTFDYPLEHGMSIAATGLYSFCSVSAEAFADTAFTTQGYALIDLIQGEQANVPHNLLPYKTFSPALQRRLRACCAAGQSLLVSGSHVGSDMRTDSERTFLSEVLKCRWDATQPPDSATQVNGLNFQFPIHRVPCAEHYAAQMPDALQPTTPAAFNAFAYANGLGAGVAYKGSDYRVITMGFPFECIQITADRHKAMQALLTFLLE